ncbi:hypothetical protein [Streptococcus suis]|uniref:Uncharacterized protein n=1 Tax=Streptococcus suis TaxID=1307 RepID=A0A0Z8DLI4_STRSU|nr:hypothetical protein [Streptococcus suis]CYT81899.1 Uncharacterised protein [Streptococcus suis]CYU15406.1 Uncharacterised protein [Streptococcus suis]CYU17796.1 Uncharacterised protein [Streptococcus suis]CYU46393.1 Uncharacterised protein [Streptococcus suis]CYU81067.1 Uncharacterised protein [Streptococcus suis]
MEKWKEFIKGAYFGFLGVGLVLVPFFVKVGSDIEKTFKSK